jgi:NADPH:quinone reductase-like Zn-dependent oxidoreductase
MRAVLIDNQKSGAEKLYIGEVETPEPENEQVLVKVLVDNGSLRKMTDEST